MGRQQAFGSLVGQAVVNRQSAVSLGYGQKKSQPDEDWDFTLWWSRGESNPRPQAITGQFYMLSCLI